MENPVGPKTTSHRVGANVRALRNAAEMTQTQLAEAMDRIGHPLHLNTISKIEKGAREVSVDELEAFARVFEVAPESMLLDLSDPEAELFRRNVDELVRGFETWDRIRTSVAEVELELEELRAGLANRSEYLLDGAKVIIQFVNRRPDLTRYAAEQLAPWRDSEEVAEALFVVLGIKTKKKGRK